MPRYAIVRDGQVENVVEWDGDPEVWSPPAGTEAVETDLASKGWTYADGAFAPAETIPPVPEVVTPRQIRLALLELGLMGAVNAYVETLAEEIRIEWEYAVEVRRDSPLIAQAADFLGIDSAQADSIFRLAVAK